jgi:uncharacterized protein (DUF433 family)
VITIPTDYKHIVLDEKGRALIEGTRTRVRELVLEHLAHGWSAEEVQWQHPHLTLPQVYSALAYYYDHQDLMEEQTSEELARLQEHRAKLADPNLQHRLAVAKQARAALD